jgi:hypothetical protein
MELALRRIHRRYTTDVIHYPVKATKDVDWQAVWISLEGY